LQYSAAVYSQCWQAHLVVVPWKWWYLVKMPILPRLDEEDEVEVYVLSLQQGHSFRFVLSAELQCHCSNRAFALLAWLPDCAVVDGFCPAESQHRY
jgi:hypothetical protein